MDALLTILKLVSALVGVISGVLAVVSDFKDKITGHLKWTGILAISLILLSSSATVTIDLIQSQLASAERKRDMDKIDTIVQNLHGVQEGIDVESYKQDQRFFRSITSLRSIITDLQSVRFPIRPKSIGITVQYKILSGLPSEIITIIDKLRSNSSSKLFDQVLSESEISRLTAYLPLNNAYVEIRFKKDNGKNTGLRYSYILSEQACRSSFRSFGNVLEQGWNCGQQMYENDEATLKSLIDLEGTEFHFQAIRETEAYKLAPIAMNAMLVFDLGYFLLVPANCESFSNETNCRSKIVKGQLQEGLKQRFPLFSK
ncbi:hypothetical protein CH371_19935 [Leptospira wolffii]|uniref:Uncharacterized protein n=1 Tax=Leptospira wolffii TaxID=409998 RepID=A0A2M9Z6Q0_9LEPT|nr:hypothetical protein [Leptospira wolffii]PJZ64095.1 hypothetical protein CH371_19935 [Leptospira wolffii]